MIDLFFHVFLLVEDEDLKQWGQWYLGVPAEVFSPLNHLPTTGYTDNPVFW